MKKTIKKSIIISASKERVWEVLLGDKTYPQWASAFYPGTYAQTSDWREDSKVYFKTPEEDGMVSRIITHKPSEVISFIYLGSIKNGKEEYSAPEIKEWQGFKETYKVSQSGKFTELSIEQDITEDYFDSFSQMWEEGLARLKELCEK
ncbi:ATPase [Chitinispirillum alkaliphilum]|nr:ATPase [Chitinispirillum alkaliphilum]